MLKLKFKDWDCFMKVGIYSNGDPAIQLFDEEDGCPVATATVNLQEAGIHPEPGNVLIKDYSENQGMSDAFIEQGYGVHVKNHDIGYIFNGVTEIKIVNPFLLQEMKKALNHDNSSQQVQAQANG